MRIDAKVLFGKLPYFVNFHLLHQKLYSTARCEYYYRSYFIILTQDEGVQSSIANISQCGYFLSNHTGCYIAAQFQPSDINDAGKEFNLGDGRVYGGYFNQALEYGVEYYVLLVVHTVFPVSVPQTYNLFSSIDFYPYFYLLLTLVLTYPIPTDQTAIMA